MVVAMVASKAGHWVEQRDKSLVDGLVVLKVVLTAGGKVCNWAARLVVSWVVL